jgi:hypothetical protein
MKWLWYPGMSAPCARQPVLRPDHGSSKAERHAGSSRVPRTPGELTAGGYGGFGNGRRHLGSIGGGPARPMAIQPGSFLCFNADTMCDPAGAIGAGYPVVIEELTCKP